MTCVNVFDNDGVPPSTHSIANLSAPAPGTEGDQFCWTVTLDAPVSGAPLTVTGTLSGTEQAVHGYANPTAVIGIGQTVGLLCVETIDDTDDELNLTLCLEILPGGRITAGLGPECTIVEDNDSVVWLPEDSLLAFEGTCQAISCSPPQPNIASADIGLSPDGSLTGTMQAGPLNWFVGGANPFDYEVMVTGSLNSGPSPLNVWLNLGTARSFVRNIGCGQSAIINGSLQIRRISDLEIVVDQDYGGYQIVTGINAQCP